MNKQKSKSKKQYKDIPRGKSKVIMFKAEGLVLEHIERVKEDFQFPNNTSVLRFIVMAHQRLKKGYPNE